MIKEGSKAPDFSLKDQSGKSHSLTDYKGKKVILYFYPKDDTPGCTKEACGFQLNYERFKKAGAVILGVSADDEESHKKFAEKYSLQFPLLSDTNREVIKAYSAWGEKSMYGKLFLGILRTTIIINEKGTIQKVYEKVKPEEHAQEILQELAL